MAKLMQYDVSIMSEYMHKSPSDAPWLEVIHESSFWTNGFTYKKWFVINPNYGRKKFEGSVDECRDWLKNVKIGGDTFDSVRHRVVWKDWEKVNVCIGIYIPCEGEKLHLYRVEE